MAKSSKEKTIPTTKTHSLLLRIPLNLYNYLLQLSKHENKTFHKYLLDLLSKSCQISQTFEGTTTREYSSLETALLDKLEEKFSGEVRISDEVCMKLLNVLMGEFT